MRKVGFAYRNEELKEILPKSYKIESLQSKRRMLCIMLNQFLSPQAQICLDDKKLFSEDILSIFIAKIESFFPLYKLRPQKSQKLIQLYSKETILFHQFSKMSKNVKLNYLSRSYIYDATYKMPQGFTHPAAELISLIFNGKEIMMMADLDLLFTQTVYKRIRREKDKKVSLDLPYIQIDQHGITTRLLPKWKNINPKKLTQRSDEINKGFEEIAKEKTDHYYLIYPKTENFQKHIRLQNKEIQKEIKMIPYSFTFCNRK